MSKASKGKEYLMPDPNWVISECAVLKNNHRGKLKKYYLNKFNRKIRQYFNRLIKNNPVDKFQN